MEENSMQEIKQMRKCQTSNTETQKGTENVTNMLNIHEN